MNSRGRPETAGRKLPPRPTFRRFFDRAEPPNLVKNSRYGMGPSEHDQGAAEWRFCPQLLFRRAFQLVGLNALATRAGLRIVCKICVLTFIGASPGLERIEVSHNLLLVGYAIDQRQRIG